MNRISDEGDSFILLSLKNSRIRRLTRFLLTAVPTFLLVVIPSRRFSPWVARIKILKCSVALLSPSRITRLNSRGLSSLSSLPREKCFINNYIPVFSAWGWRMGPHSIYAASLFLPFCLLLLKTFLPPTELILDKNPWVLFLFTLLGWYVLFKKTPFLSLINFL